MPRAVHKGRLSGTLVANTLRPPIVILIGTSHPGNAGAAARGAANFGASELRFVAPRCNIHCEEALSRGKGAGGLLENAKVYESLQLALDGVAMAIGTTARTTKAPNRHLRKTLDVRDWAEGFDGWDGQMALVFGREDSGMTSDEVNQMDQLVTIPTADYSSLNLAHAVTLLCYEHYRMRETDRVSVERSLDPDTRTAMYYAYDELVASVEGRAWRRDVASGIFRKIIGRSSPDNFEIHNIMGIFAGALRRFDHPMFRTEKSSRVLAKKGLISNRAIDEYNLGKFDHPDAPLPPE
jgi:tRNA/rRNA methyltransferase